MSDELHNLTIAAAADLIRTRSMSPVELTVALLDRIERLDPLVNAFISVTADHALAQARAAEAEISKGHLKGPLHGIPYGLKDIYNTAGIRTTGHSRVGADHVPADDAAVAARLAAAGGVLMGKLATYQFTHGGPSFDPPWPPARNPWNLDHDAGGSSSGSAASVAAGMVLGAMGSDTGGSVRIPASFCGLAGLKPSFGLVSRAGVIPNSFSCDHCGPLAWTVEDCAILLQAVAGWDDADPASAAASPVDYVKDLGNDLRGLKIGVLRHFWEEDLALDAEIPGMMAEVIAVFRSLGAEVDDTRIRPLNYYYEVKNTLTKAEVFCVHQQDLRTRADDFGPDFLGTTLGGALISAVDYVQAQRERSRILVEMEAVYRQFDLLLTANVGPAPRLVRKPPAEFWQAGLAPASLCIPFSLSGGPALSVCSGFTRGGLPLGFQLAGQPFTDALVLRAGHAYERATQWRDRKPQIELSWQPHGASAGATVRSANADVDLAGVDLARVGMVNESPTNEDLAKVDLAKVDIVDADATGEGLAQWCALRSGLTLSGAQLSQLQALLPHVEATSHGLRTDREASLEIVNVFEMTVPPESEDPR